MNLIFLPHMEKKRPVFPLFLLLLFFLLLSPARTYAAEVLASVDRTQLALGESLQLKVTVSGDEGEADLSPIKDFKVISRGTSTSINMVNGSFSQEVAYTYTLIPLRQGSLLIPPLNVSTGSGRLQTRAIRITVSDKPQAQNAPDREVYIQAQVSETSPFTGQQFVYTFRLLRSAEIANAQLRAPDFRGFTATEVEDRRQYRRVIGGKEYQVTELNYILVPLKAGDFSIGPAILNCDIVRRSNRRRGFFNDPFFGLGTDLESKVLQTESIPLKVRPLPPYEGPGRFSGLVGTFDIHTAMEPSTLKTGESATLSVVISGTGNIMDAEAPEIRVPDGFKSYNDSPEDAIKLSIQGYSGQKSFRTALVPTKAGDFTIPPVQLVFFDTLSGKYVSRTAQEQKLHVSLSDEKQEIDMVSAPLPEKMSLKKKVEFTGRDILPLKEDLNALQTGPPASVLRFLLFILLPLLLTFLTKGLLLLRSRNDDPSRIMAQRARNALKQAADTQAEPEIFLSHLYRAVVSALHARAGSSGESLTYAETADILRSKGYSEETALQAAGLLEKIESAKFSGRLTESTFSRELLKESRELLKNISV